MSVDTVPKIIHTLEKEVPIIDYAWDGDRMNVPTSMVSSTKHGVFVGDPISHGVIRIHNGHTSWFVVPPADPVAGDINCITPTGMAINEDKNLLLLVDHQAHVVRQVCITDEFPQKYGTNVVLAGASIGMKPKPGFKNGQLLKSRFRSPSGISVTMWDDILVSDTGNHVIRLIRGSRVSTFAGNGSEGFRDGSGKEARFKEPMGIVSTPQGDVFVCDVGNHRIRLIEQSGCVKTLAGSGKIGLDDGQHLASSFASPNRLVLTPRGDLVVLGHNIRFVQISGLVSTLAENQQPYVLVQKELDKLATVTKGFKARFNDALYMRQHAPSKTIVKSTKEIKTTLKPSPHDPKYHLPGKTIENTFQSVGDLTFTQTGDLLFSDPETHSIKFIPGLLAALYPLRRETSSSFEWNISPTPSPKPFDLNKLRRSFELDPWASNSQLVETHGAVISQPRFSPLDFSLTSLRTFSNPFYDFDLTLEVRGRQFETWSLHIIILFLMCPSLLLASAARRINALQLSKDSIDALLDYCYSGKLPSVDERSTSFWMDLQALCDIVKMPMMAQYACYRLQKSLRSRPSLDTAIKLIQSKSATRMSFDVVSEALSEQKEARSRSPGRLRKSLASSSSYRAFIADKDRPISIPPMSPILTSDAPTRPPSYKMPDCPPVSLKLSSSVPSLIGKNLRTASALAERVHYLHRSRDCLNSEFDVKNCVDLGEKLQEMVPMLGVLLRNPPPKKDSLVPFPELVAPDFFIKVQREYIPCHGGILYARWPWFKAQVDSIDSTKIARPVFFPFRRGTALSTKSPHGPSGRTSKTIAVMSARNWDSSAATDQKSSPSPPSLVKRPPKFNMLERWPSRNSKSYKRNRSVKIPPNTLSSRLVQGLIWYLYSGELSGIPSSATSLPIMDHAKTFGFIDDENNALSPFGPLIGYIQQSVTKELTLDNCFNTLEAAIINGYFDRAQEVREFIAKNMDALNGRINLSDQLNRLSITEREAIYAAVSVSRPEPGRVEVSLEPKGALNPAPILSKIDDVEEMDDFSESESSLKAVRIPSKIIDDEGNSETSSGDTDPSLCSSSSPKDEMAPSTPETIFVLPVSERVHPSTQAEFMKKKLADMGISKVSQTGKEPSDISPTFDIKSDIPPSSFYLTPSPPPDPRASISTSQ